MTGPRSLVNKNAIVTGASRGIGKEIARQLALQGANVAICYVSAQSSEVAEKLASELRLLGVKSTCVQEDLLAAGAATRIIDAVLIGLECEKLDILVNNAAIDPPGFTSVLHEKIADFDRFMHVNARAPLELVTAFVPRLRAEGGRIISISSVLARRPDVPHAAWAASKAALECLSRYWASELGASYGLTSNVVSIGPTMTDYYARDPPHVLEELSQLPSAAKRLGKTDDIAQIVTFLASDAARWINGDVIQGNGGMYFN